MAYQVALRTLSAQPVMSARKTTTFPQLSQSIGELLGEVWSHIERSGGRPVGPPFTRYHRIGEDGSIEIEGGLPVAAPLAASGRVQPGELPGGEAVATDHFGPYEELTRAGDALSAWAAAHGREAAGPNWEIYWTDPGAERDPAKWRTEVIKPLK